MTGAYKREFILQWDLAACKDLYPCKLHYSPLALRTSDPRVSRPWEALMHRFVVFSRGARTGSCFVSTSWLATERFQSTAAERPGGWAAVPKCALNITVY